MEISRAKRTRRACWPFRAKLGAHTLKVSLAGKQDFEQSVNVVEGQPTRVVAPLADLAGSVRVKAPAGAAIWLDNSSRGTVDSSGELLLSGDSSRSACAAGHSTGQGG